MIGLPGSCMYHSLNDSRRFLRNPASPRHHRREVGGWDQLTQLVFKLVKLQVSHYTGAIAVGILGLLVRQQQEQRRTSWSGIR